MIIKSNTTDKTIYFKLIDTTGQPATGLTITDLDLTYVRNRAAAVKNDMVALGSAIVAHTDYGGFEVDGTNAPGLYRVDLPDAALVTGVKDVQIIINGAAIDPAFIEIELDLDINNVTLTDTCTTNTDMRGTENAALAASLPTNFSDMAITSTSGRVDINVNNDKTGYLINGTKQTLDVLNDFDVSSEAVDLGSILGSTLSETLVGNLAGAFEFFYDVTTATKTVNDVGVAGTGLTAADVWQYATRALTDKTNFELSDATIDKIWDEVMPDLSNGDLDSGQILTARKIIRGLNNRFFREVTQTATTQTVKNDNNSEICSMAVSDNGTTQAKGSA